MSDDERLMSRVRLAGSVVDSVSAVGFFGPSFLVTIDLRAHVHFCISSIE